MAIPLSPSRASDFKSCPQLFKYRAVDQLPEPADPAGTRGSLVHSALQELFKLPPKQRVPQAVPELLSRGWENLCSEVEGDQLELSSPPGTLGLNDQELDQVMSESNSMMERYFLIEDPRKVRALNLEWWVEHHSEKTSLRGIIDRVDVTPEGAWILTDYKTGRSPSESYALGSFFGLKFYALVCWRTYGKMPKALRLLHLKEPEEIKLIPSEAMLEATEKQMSALGIAIARAYKTDDWRARPSKLCSWCPHRSICPAWKSEMATAV
jgi:putative RecB family exonuclease